MIVFDVSAIAAVASEFVMQPGGPFYEYHVLSPLAIAFDLTSHLDLIDLSAPYLPIPGKKPPAGWAKMDEERLFHRRPSLVSCSLAVFSREHPLHSSK